MEAMMRCGNDHSTIFKDSGDLLFGIIYPAICIICALVLVRRIRRRQQRKYILPGGQMHTPSEKSGGEQSSATIAETSYPMHTTHDHAHAPLPSACDILQPLSHSSPLPSSGYLTAVLKEERRKRVEQAYQNENEASQPTRPSCTNFEDSISMAVRMDRCPPSGVESSPTQADDLSQETSPPNKRGAEGDDRGLLSSPVSNEIQSVQKRSQQVQLLRDVDEDGVRTWRRWVIEYS